MSSTPCNPSAIAPLSIKEIDVRQDQVLQRLDELNLQIENIIELYTRNRRENDGLPVQATV